MCIRDRPKTWPNKPPKRLEAKWNRIQRSWRDELEQLIEQVFDNEVVEGSPMTYWDESLWDSIEMFGLVLMDKNLESLKGFWIDQETGDSRSDYWIPDGEESEIPTIDHPPSVDVAWDARPA